ncbi:hypothetical protein BDQ17DRAFT_1348119 [Cyathus striatus]|nr:hypothetical protein BDQ17DRAFT_1348119 [Cyathus striatus]
MSFRSSYNLTNNQQFAPLSNMISTVSVPADSACGNNDCKCTATCSCKPGECRCS